MTCEARNGRCKDPATGAHDAPGLLQSQQPILPCRQVVQRSEQERNIEGIVLELQVAGVSDDSLKCPVSEGLMHLRWHRVYQHDLMAQSRQRRGVYSCCPTDVED